MIFDSDILIEFLGRNHSAAACIENVPRLERNISVVSYLEVLYGCRSRRELGEFRQFVATYLTEVIPVTEVISRRAVQLKEDHVLSRRLGVGDALIAATALTRGDVLSTGNLKQFKFIPGLAIRVFQG
ncbi:MAG: type II toxin-antitoxin system VapC family toxin [Terriglobia bacterium]